MSDDAQVVKLPVNPLHVQVIEPPVASGEFGEPAQPSSPGPGRKIYLKPRKAHSKPVKAQSKPRKVVR